MMFLKTKQAMTGMKLRFYIDGTIRRMFGEPYVNLIFRDKKQNLNKQT